MNFTQEMSYYDNIRFHMESSENYTVQSGFDHTPSRRSSEIMVNSSSGISHESNDSVKYEQEIIESSRVANKEDLKCVLEEINCTICYHIVQNVVQCQLCEAVYCKICIERWQLLINECFLNGFKKSLKQVCPSCRRSSSDLPLKYTFLQKNFLDFEEPSIITSKVSQILKKILSKVKLYCHNQQSGCEEILSYEMMDKHSCEYDVVLCPNDDCEESLMRKEFSEHRQVCLFEPIECRFCSYKYPRNKYENHINNCPKRLISCKWCHDKYEYCQLDEHEEDCPLREITCSICFKTFRQEKFRKHTEVVCLKQLLRKKEENERFNQKQIEELKKSNLSLKEENIILREENFMLRCRAADNSFEQKDKDTHYSLDFEPYEAAVDEQSIKESIYESISEDIQEISIKEKIQLLNQNCNIEIQISDEEDIDYLNLKELFNQLL